MAEWKNETALVVDIVKAIKKAHPTAFIIKVHGGPMQEPGLPDLVFCVEGFFFGLEVKHQKVLKNESEEAARERTTPLQRIKIMKINAAGGTACTILTPEEALEVIDRTLTRHKETHARDHQ